MGRKYEKYSIIVKYIDGSEEKINLAGMNTSSYNAMLSVYHRIKDTYSEKAKTISFVGIGQDGTMSIMFTKEIKRQGREDLRQDIEDIMENISKQMLLIKEKMFYHPSMIDALNKKQDVKLHEIEGLHSINFENEILRNEAKLKLYNELEDIRIERRWHKNQLQAINRLCDENINGEKINFTHLSNVFKLKVNKKIVKPLNTKLAEDLKIYKEEVVKNDKSKQIAKLKKDFERIIEDPVENKLICYNKAKAM